MTRLQRFPVLAQGSGTNPATRLVYLAVGAAAVAEAVELGRTLSD